MQTIVLAAGEGTRMRPLTATSPKPMLPVAGRPLVEHVVDAAIDAGASELIFVVGYRSGTLSEHFGTEYRGVPVTYAEQTEQRGTGDAVRTARPHLDDAPFAVLNGDVLVDAPSVKRLFESGPSVGAMHVDDPTAYGVFRTAPDDDTRVTGVVEKPSDPPSTLVNAGIYVFPAAARDWLDVPESVRGERELTDVLDLTCESTDVTAVELDRWLDVGRPWELLEANEWKLSELDTRIDGEVSEDAQLTGPVVVESGATVRSGVTIEGPALVREGAEIGPNAYVRGATLVERNATIGHAVEVKNSILRSGATVAHLSYVGDSILGRDVNFGAGTTVANLRHDDEPVRLTVKGERVSTDRRKFGVVVADGVKTAIDTSLNAGVVLGEGARTKPGEAVLRDR